MFFSWLQERSIGCPDELACASTRFSPPTSTPSRTIPSPQPSSRLTAAAVVWLLAYGLLGLSWALGGNGFPFGEGHDPDPDYSNLATLAQAVGGPVIAVWGLIGAVAVASLARPTRRGWLSAVSVGLVMAEALTLLLVVPDFRVLIRVAYAPVVLTGAPFGWPPEASVAAMAQWTVMNQFVCIIGGVLLLATALVHHRRLTGACTACGRHAGSER
jgi:hypothetical protein